MTAEIIDQNTLPVKRTVAQQGGPDVLRVSIAGQQPFEVKARNDITFSNQNPGEKVYLLIRKHWITNLGWILRYIFYALIPLIVYILLNIFKINASFISWRAYTLLLLIYYSLIFTGVIRLLSEWYLNPFIVTNERIIDYNFQTLGRFNITELFLENIEDVRQKGEGFIGELFNFGTINLSGEGEHTQMNLFDVPDPILVRGVLSDLFETAKLKYGKR